MSSYLWRYYLENDAERFQRLLEGSQSYSHTSSHGGHRTAANRTGLTTPSGSLKSSPAGILANKHRPGSPPVNVIITKKMLAEVDVMGRSILHLACTEPDRLPFVAALLAHPLTDPSLVDLESGWTCLHRALYHGNISAAREIVSANPGNWSLVKSKDHAGDAPFEVFDATIQDMGNTREEENRSHTAQDDDEEEEEDDDGSMTEQCAQGKGDEVFSWGSNKNMTLGFMDGDDRSYPERIVLPRPRQLLLEEAKRRYSGAIGNHGKTPEELLDASVLFGPVNFEDIHLSKYHSAILTTDPHSNLFICGFGRGGRLGFGDEQNVQFTFRPLVPPLLPKKKVERVALGQDHTVVVLRGGEVWTWGSNQHGQLGYTLPQKSPKDEPLQSTPRQVVGLLRKEPIIGCAASRVHTAVFTAESLFTFGRNDGQLGILDSSDARAVEIQTSPRKVAANFLNGSKFKEVVAIDKATAVLLENHEVWILAAYGYWRITFPMERFVGLPAGAKNITRYDTGLNFIKKITGGGDTVCALSQHGDVFALDVEATAKERTSRGSGKVVWQPTRAWSLRKKHMAVRDLDVGAEGNIIICTQSGSVWNRAKRAKANDSGENRRYKFNRVPGLTRITAVRSTTTGVFAAIRRDSDLMRTGLVVEPPSLWDDVSQLLSFGGLFEEEVEEEDTGRVGDDEEWGYGPQPRPRGYGKAVQWFMQPKVDEELSAYLLDLEMHEVLDSWDMTISTSKHESIKIPVHGFILSRSPVLRKLVSDGSGNIPGVCDTMPSADGKLRLILHDVELLTLLNLVYYLHIDTIIDLWHQRGVSKAHQDFFKSLRVEFSRVATALDLKPLVEAVGRMHYPPRCLHRDLHLAYRDPEFFRTADMVIDVADGDSLMVHSALMRLRCPFFEALYGGGASGRWLLGRRLESEPIHVDMKHVPKDIMEKVVSWLYYDWETEGFDQIRAGVDDGDVDQFLDFVLDVMSTANELMLERLIQVCQKVVGRYINTRNASGLLMSVAPCSEKGFKKQCLQYICSNLETMLENHLLDDLDSDLMLELDNTVRSNQRRFSPRSRSGKQEAHLLSKYPTMQADSEKGKAASIAHYAALADENFLSTSLKAQSGCLQSSASPFCNSAPRTRRKNAKTGPPASPLIKPSHGNDDIFSMDDDDLPPPSTTPKDIKGKAPAPAWNVPSPANISPSDPFLFHPPPTQRSQTAPWNTPFPSSGPSKLAMKEIMTQASAAAAGKSALSAQLKQSKPAQTPVKISQKERKRQQHQQQQQQPAVSAIPEKKPAWNIDPSTSAPRVSLKDVLASSPAAAVSPAQTTPPQRRTAPAAATASPTPKPRAAPPVPSSKQPPQFTPTCASYSSSYSAPKPVKHQSLPLSLQDIIDQEEAHKEAMKEYTKHRSLQAIQEEQAFLRWWEEESRRVQEEEAAGKRESERVAKRGRGGGGGARGRGRAPSSGGKGGGGHGGRGRGRDGGQGLVKAPVMAAV
ncbi:hypothetical protein FN846DRAFT_783230 [Sphaerosporella brunnea]|uniref:BTB domain-containing protein n=1 Tax=Sphaerosporella brunnea TaxID=1250544 RepID=A0A5J5EMK3_9PEZI|nr:hypothetical protein FN846DRAFT_783230 [Sphaerosporella brunnea]